MREFLDHLEAVNYSPRTIETYRFNMLKAFRWLSRAYQVHTADKIRQEHLHAWLKHLHNYRTGKGYPLKPLAVNKLIESFRGFLKHLAVRGYVMKSLPDALQYVKTPKLLPTSVLTHAQVKSLFSKIDTTTPEGYRDRTVLELLYSTGIRRNELLSLDLADVHLKEATALVSGKGRKQRVVPIGTTALKYLESYIRGVRSFLLRGTQEDALFLNHCGVRMQCNTLRERIHTYAGLAGLRITVTPHTFRRSCTTELIRGGANLYHVKDLLGHEDLNTLKPYTKLTIMDLKKTHARCHPRERDNR